MTTASTTTANSVIAKAKSGSRPVFYTNDRAPVKIALWMNTRSTKPNAPVLTGKIGGVSVSGFLQTSGNRKFISFVSSKLPDGSYKSEGTGNLVVGPNGYPKLVIKRSIWADTTREATNEFLASLGLDVELMLAKQAESKAAREARTGSEAAAQAQSNPQAGSAGKVAESAQRESAFNDFETDDIPF